MKKSFAREIFNAKYRRVRDLEKAILTLQLSQIAVPMVLHEDIDRKIADIENKLVAAIQSVKV